MKTYLRPSAAVSSEIIIKHSRFICYIAPVTGRAEAEAFIDSIRRQHPKANHNCWSYVAGYPEDPQQWNCSDDGEPKGTAGQPMLNILRHSGMGQICAVVTRYFGGVKLGTGGLVRAYGQSLNESIRLLETEEVVPQSAISLSAGYDLTGDLEQLIARFSIQVEERLFEEQLVIHGRIEAQQLDDLKQALQPIQHKVTLTADE
ncbi:YigZ family protein [Aliamphritea spongicola]|uniref:YigZ family protein n=1 Tax=Aliamphritea spongicola TaxID=707589 RepID=UPI00196B07DC|nr:YigZ family protein [Aliamphritea spongicola]MBN3561548.1 YigZ family protein [Aliamphritea spongicola]